MPHDPPTGNPEPAKTICKRLEIVERECFGATPCAYAIYHFEINKNTNILQVLFTGTLDQCLEFVRENMA